ncbi:putative zinc-binding peptidase [Xanthobacter sp. V4C-4]|uniref:zinc-binding metallopeptidase family protein n=1 Tax=Xanthobacter cornucopiae TaxID=3119924 RepID=UPI003727D248
MQLFKCQTCAQVLYFENTICERCQSRIGYLPGSGVLSAVEPDGTGWIARANPGPRYRFCENWERNACNWMVDAGEGETLCLACRHNRTIPDICDPENHRRWQKIEAAKRRLFYSLVKLALPIPTVASGDHEPLVFDFLADPTDGGPRIMTGHDNGLITIALTEADDAAREQARASMGELYRTLLGHFRHEVGHYYWDRLVSASPALEGFRALFGDERQDYGEALARHYENGPPPGWHNGFVSAYATMHPWEDWAETWAHYLHIVDTLEMAGAFGIKIAPDMSDDPALEAEISFDPHRVRHARTLVDAWLPLTYAVNSLNRSMGQGDLYPFVIPPPVVDKLEYIHALVHANQAG